MYFLATRYPQSPPPPTVILETVRRVVIDPLVSHLNDAVKIPVHVPALHHSQNKWFDRQSY